MNANKKLEFAIFDELYSAELDTITRHDANFDGYIFQDVTVEGDTITLTYDEVHSAEGLFQLLDGGVVTAEDAEYDAEELAKAANEAFDPVEDLAEGNAEHEERVRAIAGQGFTIAYKVDRAIDAEVVTEYMTARLGELAQELPTYDDVVKDDSVGRRSIFIYYYNGTYSSYPRWRTFRVRATNSEIAIIRNLLEMLDDGNGIHGVTFGMGTTYDAAQNSVDIVCRCDTCAATKEAGYRVVFNCRCALVRRCKAPYSDFGSIRDVTEYLHQRRANSRT